MDSNSHKEEESLVVRNMKKEPLFGEYETFSPNAGKATDESKNAFVKEEPMSDEEREFVHVGIVQNEDSEILNAENDSLEAEKQVTFEGQSEEFDEMLIQDVSIGCDVIIETNDDVTNQCGQCNQIFSDNESLQLHLKSHALDKRKQFNCDHCGHSFVCHSMLVKHLNIHGDKPKCKYCGKLFNDNGLLKKHLKVHAEKPKCEYCGKYFNDDSKLKNHLMIHTGERPFQCDHCEEKFIDQKNLRRHNLTRHKNKCKFCGEVFTDKMYFDKHVETHIEENPFKCVYCHQHFRLKRYLRPHLKTCIGVPYKCNLCNNAFKTEVELESHVLVHTEEKQFQCDQCGKDFQPNVDLVYPAEKKPYKCVCCEKTFRQRGAFKIHMKIHSSEKLLTCSDCK